MTHTMTTRVLMTFAALGALAAPARPAAAQVYPERLPSVTRVTEVGTRTTRYQGDARRETQTERVTKSVRLSPDGEVVISNISGDIVVTRGSGNDVTIDAVKTARARTAEEAKAILEMLRVEIVDRQDRVEIRAHYPRGDGTRRRSVRNFSGGVDFTITAPERARITANSLSGDISVKDIKGELSLETISGDISIANAGHVSQASTASGHVEILDTTIDGALDANTISGTMRLRNVKANRVDVGSVSGNVVLHNVQSARVDAESLSGHIELAGPLVRGGRYDLGSHSGEIRIAIAGDVGFELEASSFSGTIRSDFDLKGGEAERASRGGHRRSLSGTYGDGSAFLDVSTFSGSVVITR